uniref:Uncharacterized protein n=1 Tax=Plectus sambesii TaxID=2011161 RepID=A0A914XF35_9BILA
MFDQANSDFGAKKFTMVLPSSSNRQVKLKKATKQWDDSDSDVPEGHLSITTEATEKTLVVVADRQKRLVSVDDAKKADKRVVNVNPSRSADLCVTVGKEAMGDDGSSRKRKDEPKKTKSTRHSSTADSDDDSSYPARRR